MKSNARDQEYCSLFCPLKQELSLRSLHETSHFVPNAYGTVISKVQVMLSIHMFHEIVTSIRFSTNADFSP